MVIVFLFILIRLKLLLLLQKTATKCKVGLNSKNDILAPNLEVNNRNNINLANSRLTICGVNWPIRPIFRPPFSFVFFSLAENKKNRRLAFFYQPSVFGFWQSVWCWAIVGVSHPTFYEKYATQTR